MSKIVCEICGTAYEDTAAACPICGWVCDTAAVISEDDLDVLEDTFLNEEPAPAKKNRAIFDFDAVNEPRDNTVTVQSDAEYADDDEEDEEYEEEAPRTNMFLVAFLVIAIILLLLTIGYILFRFYLPGKRAENMETTAPSVTETIAPTTEETTAPTVPCTSLALPSGIDVLQQKGQYWLLHVVKLPEDTTDTVTYASSDEEVAVVSEDGRVTAMGEGEAMITVTCGTQQITCPVTVRYEEDTLPPENPEPMVTVSEGPAPAAATEETQAEAPQPEVPAAAEAPAAAPGSDVVLKLKKTDIKIGGRGLYVRLELDCDLSPEEVGWFSSDSAIVMVDNGKVTAMAPGTATVYARYGEQQVECIVRCDFS